MSTYVDDDVKAVSKGCSFTTFGCILTLFMMTAAVAGCVKLFKWIIAL